MQRSACLHKELNVNLCVYSLNGRIYDVTVQEPTIRRHSVNNSYRR